MSAEFTIQDFESWLLVKSGSTGLPMPLLLKMATVSINQLIQASSSRWPRLEYGHNRSAPFWLDEREAEKLVKILRNQRGAECRLLMQEIRDLFDGLPVTEITPLGGKEEEVGEDG